MASFLPLGNTVKSQWRWPVTLKSRVLVAALAVSLFDVSTSQAGSAPCRDLFRKVEKAESAQVPKATRRAEADVFVLDFLKSIYGIKGSEARLRAADFEDARFETIASRPERLVIEDIVKAKDPNWILDMVQYMGYVNHFGSRDGSGTFSSLRKMVSYLKRLGVNTFYALPFLKSPFNDAGFDVSNYEKVDPRFGSNDEFRAFMSDFKKEGGLVQMDLVFNHVSKDHLWAKKALAGDSIYRGYFHILEHPPDVVDVRTLNGKPVEATYREIDASGRSVNIKRKVVFPDFADLNHPHYTRTKDRNGKEIWVYHTFYPFQWDLNFNNPSVLREAYKIVGYWANQGVDVFRLDAIPFLMKNQEGDPRTHQIVRLLNYFLKQVAPRTVLKVEACQAPEKIAEFIGKAERIYNYHLGVWVETTSGAQLAYHFPLMPSIFASFFAQDKRFIEKILSEMPLLPEGAAWAIFLRLHDELTLEPASAEEREIIQRALLPTKRGVAFGSDLGIGGRISDFLGHDPEKISLLFSIMLSQKGVPIIYYGDEIMISNNFAYADKAAQARGGNYDARDVNRGPVQSEEFFSVESGNAGTPQGGLHARVAKMIRERNNRVSMRRGDVELLANNQASVLSYKREISGGEKTIVVQNLSEKSITVRISARQAFGQAAEVKDLLTEKMIRLKQVGDSVEILLEPLQSLWLDVK